MDDKAQKNFKPGLPPFPPGMAKPNLPPPPLPRAGQPPAFSAPQLPPLPAQAYVSAPAMKDNSGAERARMAEEKEKLEKKISEMEKVVAQEKEKSLMAALKSQQDEALSSRVESSLKDIQEKMRRDRRDSQVEEERISLKGKIKELESRLAQERETWMQTLKGQLAERETQGRDVEGHFIYRLQEMERRWLDEKGQWQKALSEREETIRSLKSSAERLDELKDEFRKLSMEKTMAEKEISKLRDDVARADRERASVETYIKIMPEKEREIAEVKAENSLLRMREEKEKDAAKHREEKLLGEIAHREESIRQEMGRLQAELGSIADRKNSEKNEEVQKLQQRFQQEMQEKDRTLADLAGEKMRAISELLKVKGFVSRVQAVNAAMDKERGQLRLEKMQLAQTMASQLEDLKTFRQASEAARAAMQSELRKINSEHEAELVRIHNEELSRTAVHRDELSQLVASRQIEADKQAAAYQAELSRLTAAHQAELGGLASAHQAELGDLASAHQVELGRQASAHQTELARLTAANETEQVRLAAANAAELARQAAAHQAELAKLTALSQAELAKLTALSQAELDDKICQIRVKYDTSAEEGKSAVKRQLEEEYSRQIKELRSELTAAERGRSEQELENKKLAARQQEFEQRAARLEAERQRLEAGAGALAAQKAEAEKQAGQFSMELAALREKMSALAAGNAALEGDLASLNVNYKTESENRARFESELLFLKQKIQQMEYQAKEAVYAFDTEREDYAAQAAAAQEQQAGSAAVIADLTAKLDSYKALEKSFSERLKWALKKNS